MNVVLLAKHKRSAARALEAVVRRGCSVAAVVVPPAAGGEHQSQRVDLVAERHGLPLLSEGELYERLDELEGRVDLVLSVLFPRLIRRPLIDLPRVACLNFHPAPLPDWRGLGGYNLAILEGLSEWGASAHFVDESFDTGDLVRVRRFAMDPETETAWSLDLRSQEHLVELFGEVLDLALSGRPLPREPQGPGRYVSEADLERLRRVPEGADAAEVERRVRAFWHPPWPGATIERGGRVFTLVDQRRLEETAAAYLEAGQVP
jgi:methionyl-tRNA formyltransferase